MLKIRNIFSINYALSILLSEDGFTLNKVQLEKRGDNFQKEKNKVKVAASFFKVEIVKLLFELFFSKTPIEVDSSQLFDELLHFLIGFEEYRFKVMTFQTKLLSYRVIYKKFVRRSDIFTYYQERLAEASWFQDNLKDDDLESNYSNVMEKIEERVQEADNLVNQYESVYFYYLKYLINILVNVVESKKLKDVNFKIEESAIGKRIKLLIKELHNKSLVYRGFASAKSMESIHRFTRLFSPEVKDAVEEHTHGEIEDGIIPWDTLAFDRIKALLSIKLPTNKTINRLEYVRKPRRDVKRVTAMVRSIPTDNTSENTDTTIEWGVADNYKTFYELLEENPITKRKINEEKLSLALSILNFDKQLDKDRMIEKGLAKESLIQKVNLKKDDLIRKMIKYIENQVNDKNAEANLKNLLEVFSLMIRESTEQREIQDIFNNNKAMEMVLLVLSGNRPLETSFLQALLVFANSMLDNKNVKVQKAVCKHFKTFKQTERTLRRFSSTITQMTARIKDDNKKFFASSAQDEGMQICIQVLKFIVVCCKGHFKEMQDYFRIQPSTSIQFNFIKDTIDLLNALSNELTSNNYPILILCFDVLIEAVQGPNKENQEFLLKSSILETLAKLLGYSVQMELKSKKSQLKSTIDNQLSIWEVRKVKSKVVTLIQGLTELADYPQNVYNRLSKFFSIYLLLIYIEDIYNSYIERFGDELQYQSLNQVGFS
jgi:hypothetical protein